MMRSCSRSRIPAIGIPEDRLERIFEEYYQIGPEGTQRLGVGLGLAIVREVSRLLGYSVSVASTLGKGTRVSRAYSAAPRAARRTIPGAKDPETPSASQPAGCRLILLEDNDSVRMATELFLSLEGFETRSAATLAEAERLAGRDSAGRHIDHRLSLGRQVDGAGCAQPIAHRARQRCAGNRAERRFAVDDAGGKTPILALPLPEQAGRHQITARGDRRAAGTVDGHGCFGGPAPSRTFAVFHHPPPSAANSATVS